MWTLLVPIILLFYHPAFGVIYDLNETEYNRMPPMFYLDEYTDCLDEANGIYCTARFSTISDLPNDLWTMMQDYSKQYKTHYNHTSLVYGICLTQKCSKYLEDKTQDLKLVLEECLNEKFWDEYKLKTQVTEYSCNGLDDKKIAIDTSDIAVGLLITSLIILNIIGSFTDFYFSKNDWLGKKYIVSFSVMRNWTKLTARLDHRLSHHRSINGFKCIITVSVIMCHSRTPGMVMPENSHEIEKTYNGIFEYILLNGTMAIQIFFFMTGFLLMNKILQYSETNGIKFSLFPKGLIMRLFRIIPVYAVVLGIMATWFRRFGSGPFWEEVAMQPVSNCRNNWWLHLLFLNNFVYNSQCLGTSWYIAADMQLYVLGLLVCVLAKTDGNRRKVLKILYVLGIIIPAAVVYFLDLEGRLITAIEPVRVFFMQDATYNELYVRGYTNIAPLALGMMVSDLVYRWQWDKTSVQSIQGYKIFRYVYCSLLPLALGLIISGKYFYMHAYLQPRYTRVLYALTANTLFTLIIAILFVGFVLKFENVYRSLFEWEGWVVPSRLSYSAFVVHFPVIRLYMATRTQLLFVSPLNMLATFTGIVMATLLLATLLWLFVESPFSEISNIYLQSKTKQQTNGLSHKTE